MDKATVIDALVRAGDTSPRGTLESLTVAQLRNRFIRTCGYDPFDGTREVDMPVDPHSDGDGDCPVEPNPFDDLPPVPEPDEVPQPQQDDDLMRRLAEAVQPHLAIKPDIDEAKVREIVKAEVAGIVQPLTIKVESPTPELPDFEGTVHELFPKLLALVNQRRPDGQRWNVYLYGAPGGGKTTACKQVADALHLEFGYISLLPQSPRSDVTGFIDAGGTFRDTVFHRLYTNGGVFLFDELDNASDSLLTSLNAALENGQASFPDGIYDRHPDFIAIGAGNTAARGGERNHAGRRALDGATIERFVFLQWGYDEKLESSLCTALNPEHGPVWSRWVQDVRSYCRTAHPHVIASPRASMYAAQLAETTMFTPAEVADAVMFKGIAPDTVKNIIANVPLPAAKKQKGKVAA